jgi:hypothetical protein
MGSTVMVSSAAKPSRRVLHVRLGRPLTSALHEPHFAALQFQRTARSFACVLDLAHRVQHDHPDLGLDLKSTKRPRVAPPD